MVFFTVFGEGVLLGVHVLLVTSLTFSLLLQDLHLCLSE